MKNVAFISFVMLFSLLVMLSPQAKIAFDGWNTGGWTKSTEGNSDVFTGVSGKTFNQLSYGSASSLGCVAFDIQIASSYGTVDGNVGVSYKLSNGDEVFFEYNTVYHYLNLRRIGQNGAQTALFRTDRTLSENEWYHFSAAVTDSRIQWYIDRECIYDAPHSYTDLANGSFSVQGYYAAPKIRRLYFYPQGDPDFEFTEPMSARTFTAHNGAVSYSDGKLVYQITGSDSYIQSMYFTAPYNTKNSEYFANLSVKNTILIHLKNDTDADSVKVYFITEHDGNYSESKAKIFPVTPHGEQEPVFCNFSDLSTANGAVRGMRIVPVGVSSGTISIEAITFEREKALYPYAGSILSCTADGETVTITGTLGSAYAGKKIYPFTR